MTSDLTWQDFAGEVFYATRNDIEVRVRPNEIHGLEVTFRRRDVVDIGYRQIVPWEVLYQDLGREMLSLICVGSVLDMDAL